MRCGPRSQREHCCLAKRCSAGVALRSSRPLVACDMRPSSRCLAADTSVAPGSLTSARCRIEGDISENVDGTTACDGTLGLGRFELPVWLPGLHGLSWDASTPDEAGLVHWLTSLLVVRKLEFPEAPATRARPVVKQLVPSRQVAGAARDRTHPAAPRPGHSSRQASR